MLQSQHIEYFLHRLRNLSIHQKTQTERKMLSLFMSDKANPYNVINLLASHILKYHVFMTNDFHASWDVMFDCLSYTILIGLTPEIVSRRLIVFSRYSNDESELLKDNSYSQFFYFFLSRTLSLTILFYFFNVN